MKKRQTKKTNETLCANALMNPDDFFGDNYMLELSKGIATCFCCLQQLSNFRSTCSICKKDFHFCKKCHKDNSMMIIIGFGRCVFCFRRSNKLLADKLGVEVKGLYGDENIYNNHLLEPSNSKTNQTNNQ